MTLRIYAHATGRFFLAVFLLASCDEQSVEDQARQAATAAEKEAREVVAQAASEAEKEALGAVESARRTLAAKLKEGEAQTASYVQEQLQSWLKSSGSEAHSLEKRAASGSGSAGEVAAMAKALSSAVDGETVVLPVYRELGADEHEDIDAAIGDMPRTEVIDGLTIGFKKLRHTDSQRHLSEDGYLVLWRQDHRLVGFVYRSRRDIDIDAVVDKTPELVAAVRTAMR